MNTGSDKKVPETAFASYADLYGNKAFKSLVSRLAEKTGQLRDDANFRFRYVALPLSIVGGFGTQVGFQIAYQELCGRPSSGLANFLAYSASFALLLGTSYFASGAAKRYKALHAMHPASCIVSTMDVSDLFLDTPVKPEFRQAVRTLEAMEKTMPLREPK